MASDSEYYDGSNLHLGGLLVRLKQDNPKLDEVRPLAIDSVDLPKTSQVAGQGMSSSFRNMLQPLAAPVL